ncbi:MAG: hypothetical protein V3S92_02670, partial [Alphaproteobacteria bacterium]
DRAEEVLCAIEQGEKADAVSRLADDLPLFAAAPMTRRGPSALEQALDEVNPDQLTPRQALELLYRLKGVATGEGDDGEG